MGNDQETTKRHIFRQFCFVTLLLAGMLTSLAYGQGGTTGAISGIVTDNQGAVIPGAEVQAVNVTTGVTTSTKTNDAGVYTFPYLQLGQYQVEFDAKSMKERVVSGVVVDEANISRVDGKLEIGSASETVNVTDSAPLIEQESTTIDASVDNKLVQDLPSVAGGGTRAATDILQILPGVQTPGGSSGNSYGSQFGVNIGGGRVLGTEFQMDGMTLAYQGITAGVPLDMRPDYDLTTEVKVQEGVPSAEFGRTAGGVVTFLSRSGADQFHGDLGVFIKNTIFDAHPYNTDTVTTDQNWEMPLSIGGPVWIPHIYDGRKKTFFFVNSTTYRQKNLQAPGTATVPTAKERGGDFSDQSYVIYDPTTGKPFPNNMIPSARIDAVAKQINAFYPLPSNTNLTSNLTGFTPSSTLEDDQFVRVDHQISASNHFMASYRHRNEPNVYSSGGPFGAELSGDTSPRSLHEDTVQDDWTITPHVVNHFSAGDIAFYTAQLSNPTDHKYWIPVPNSFGQAFPSFCFLTQNYSGLGQGVGSGCSQAAVNYELDRSRDFQDTVFWNKSAHNIKIGARYLWYQAASGQSNGLNGQYEFSQNETSQFVGGSPVPGTGNSFASFLLGQVDFATMVAPDVPDEHAQTLGIYAQDDWRVNSKLSVNFGLRWDIQPPTYETQKRFSEMSPTTPNSGAGGLPGAYIFAAQQGVKNFVPTWYGGWAPRFGAAYSVRPDVVVRASFGVLLSPPSFDGASTDSTGYSGSKTVQSLDSGATPGMVWATGWTNVVKPPSFNPTQQNGGSAITASINADRWPATNMWSLDIQKSFGRNFGLAVSYIGSNTHHLAAGFQPEGTPVPNSNQVNPGYLSLGSLLTKPITDPAVVAAGYTAPFPGFVALYGPTVPLAQALKPFPQYSTVGVVGNRVYGSNYNALEVKAEHHFSHGFQYLASYTFSKTLTSAPLNFQLAYGYPGPQNIYNLRAEKYLSGYDIPQALVLSFTYALPVGPGQTWLNHGFASNILGGWAASGILTYDAGIPVTVTGPNILPLGNGRTNVNYVGGPITKPHGKIVIGGDVAHDAPTVVLNSAAFAEPAPFTLGNTYILPSTRQAAFKSENVSFFKRETFKDRYIFELRFDMINLPNRKDPTGLDTGITDAGFGTYGGSGIGPRSCQLDGKLTF